MRATRWGTCLSFLFLFALPCAAQPVLYSVSRDDNLLRQIQPTTGATLFSVPLTIATGTVMQANGIAVHPTTGVMYGIIRPQGGDRQLGLIDPATGATTLIGLLGDNFAGIAFDSGGVLYGVTGDGAVQPESLFTIDLTTAVPTFVFALGNGSDGETIAYNTSSGLLYHASGLSSGAAPPVFESIDLATGLITPVPLTGFGYDEALGMTYDVGADSFLVTTLSDEFVTITPSGFVTLVGPLDHTAKGLAFVNSQMSPQFERGNCDAMGSFNIADPIFLLSYLFPTGAPPTLSCEDACDGNDDGTLNLTDAVALLNALFATPPIALPEPLLCGADPSASALTCAAFASCP
ncbi:MAG: hypothetical protein AAF581_02715 [Planctomycetota bacterium]